MTFGFTLVRTASKTSRPARSMAAALLEGQLDVGLVGGDQRLDDVDDVAAGEVVGFELVGARAAARP